MYQLSRAHSQNAPSGLSAAAQLLLLIDGRSAHIGMHSQNHAGMALTEQTDMADLIPVYSAFLLRPPLPSAARYPEDVLRYLPSPLRACLRPLFSF